MFTFFLPGQSFLARAELDTTARYRSYIYCVLNTQKVLYSHNQRDLQVLLAPLPGCHWPKSVIASVFSPMSSLWPVVSQSQAVGGGRRLCPCTSPSTGTLSEKSLGPCARAQPWRSSPMALTHPHKQPQRLALYHPDPSMPPPWARAHLYWVRMIRGRT